MIYDREYVKTLIRRRADAVITEAESGELEAAQKIFTDEELADMVSEVFLEIQEEVEAKDAKKKKEEERKSFWSFLGGGKSAL